MPFAVTAPNCLFALKTDWRELAGLRERCDDTFSEGQSHRLMPYRSIATKVSCETFVAARAMVTFVSLTVLLSRNMLPPGIMHVSLKAVIVLQLDILPGKCSAEIVFLNQIVL